MVRVDTAARLHFGFGNLSLSHERLYGALGVALEEPRTVVNAEPADTLSVEAPAPVAADARTYATRACELLDVPGASVTVMETIPRHVGLGSGTQLALAILQAVAQTREMSVSVRELAPELGRGGRSGIGVASFEDGGFVLDAGHPTTRFTTERPETGAWAVPRVAAVHEIPSDWRFLVVLPATEPGRSGAAEDAAMRTAVERAEPGLANRIAGIITRRVLPAICEGRPAEFGEAVADVGRLNGAWYADEQGGVYRPPVGDLVASLDESPSVYGAGQSSWGPAVYGVTDAENADAARRAGRDALEESGTDGDVMVVEGRNRGARIE